MIGEDRGDVVGVSSRPPRLRRGGRGGVEVRGVMETTELDLKVTGVTGVLLNFSSCLLTLRLSSASSISLLLSLPISLVGSSLTESARSMDRLPGLDIG